MRAPDDAYRPNNSCAATPMGNSTYPGLVCKHQGGDDMISRSRWTGAMTCAADITAEPGHLSVRGLERCLRHEHVVADLDYSGLSRDR
ncbi:MAG: hypothetical protein R3E96_16040 [Planctomycetota bacterium]